MGTQKKRSGTVTGCSDMPNRKRSRKEDIKIDATPEEIARAIFSAAKKPDPSLRKPRGKSQRLGQRGAA